MDDVVCPVCRGELTESEPAWTCAECGARYRALRGIPDLRVEDDVFLSNAADWAYASRLDEAFDRLDFLGLLDLYFDLSPEIPPDLRNRQIASHPLGPRESETVGRSPASGTR